MFKTGWPGFCYSEGWGSIPDRELVGERHVLLYYAHNLEHIIFIVHTGKNF